MIVIKTLTIKKAYRYLWLKTVKDVDLTQHCAKCLIGEYSKQINRQKKHYENITLEHGGYYYLCGVRNYKENIHLAFKFSPGNNFTIDTPNYYIRIRDAIPINFDEKSINQSLPQSQKTTFRNCRNWQFANWFANKYK